MEEVLEEVLTEESEKDPSSKYIMFMLFANTLALAVEEYASNGLWEYGASKRGFGYSNYFNSSYLHHSTVVNPKKIIVLEVLEKQENGQRQDTLKYHQLD